MPDNIYRIPAEREATFLRIVTHGYPELEQQVASCLIAEYDPTGWCYVSVLGGPPFLSPNHMADGPGIVSNGGLVEIILWTNAAFMLDTIEVVSYMPGDLEDAYGAFIEAANSNTLRYRSKEKD